MSAIRRSVITGCGSYLPETILTNNDLAKRGIDTSDEWIVQRTGIKSRHIAADGEYTSDLAAKATLAALKHADVKIEAVDIVIVATTTPDSTFPATAARVQEKIGMTRGFAFDVQAACSGFIYALTLADNFIRLGQAKTIVVIGAEVLSRIVDWKDRSTCVLFGDGAGAVVLQAQDGKGDKTDRGILSTHLYSDGRYYDFLCADGGVGSTQTTGYIRMEGKEVFRHAVTNLSKVVDEALLANDLQPDEIEWLVPHQANMRIMEGNAKKLKLPKERVVITISRHANTAAASIPLALAEAVADGRIKQGQLIMFNTMGAGFTWGAAVVRL
ncbi:MAG: ketoacyl-ACP synthase III [Alphaproteobacteria bacterium]|nr:ketoacyl-ACP synthase III [Alphaproteobacteria bacterium]